MKLFVDDKRDAPSKGYESVGTYSQAIMLLGIMPFDFIDLDYSLEEEKTGLDILKWMYEKTPIVNLRQATGLLGVASKTMHSCFVSQPSEEVAKPITVLSPTSNCRSSHAI